MSYLNIEVYKCEICVYLFLWPIKYFFPLGNKVSDCLWNNLHAEHGSHPARSAKDFRNYHVCSAGKEALWTFAWHRGKWQHFMNITFILWTLAQFAFVKQQSIMWSHPPVVFFSLMKLLKSFQHLFLPCRFLLMQNRMPLEMPFRPFLTMGSIVLNTVLLM